MEYEFRIKSKEEKPDEYDNAVECATMDALNVNIQWQCRVINNKDPVNLYDSRVINNKHII